MTDAARMLTYLYANTQSGLIELRPIRRGGGAGKQQFLPLGDGDGAAATATELGQTYDCYFGVAPRTRQDGSKTSVAEVPAVWVDIDEPGGPLALATFELPPSIVVASGSSDGRHAYWVLDAPTTPQIAETLNRALAARLDGDEHVVDAGRVLRLPGTLNHKYNPPAEVRLDYADDTTYCVEALASALNVQTTSQLPAATAHREASPTVQRVLDKLDGVKAGGRGWRAHCPAHDDQNPSLSIDQNDGGDCLLRCFAGCSAENIVVAIGLDQRDLFATPAKSARLDSQAGLLALIADAEGKLIHDKHGKGYALIPSGEQRQQQCIEIASREFEDWLRHRYYRAHTASPSKEAVAGTVGLLSAQARYDGDLRDVHRRVGGDLERLYIDLGEAGSWRVVEVSREGWRILDRSPVAFVRDGGTQPLPVPRQGGTLEQLRPLINAPDDSQWALIRGALLAMFHPSGPYFATLIRGGAGSGKSVLARRLANLVDPHGAQFFTGVPQANDMIVAASSSWLIGLDNVSHIRRDMSDFLCTLCTGAGDRRRALYTNADSFSLEAKRPIVITSIPQVATRADLVDRGVPVSLPNITSNLRTPESVLDAKFSHLAPEIFAGLLDALVAALRHLPSVHLTDAPRMADAAYFVTAAEEQLDGEGGIFLAALRDAQGEALGEAIYASPFLEAVVRLIDAEQHWEGRASDLLATITSADPPKDRRSWPSNAWAASKELDEYAAPLAEHGIACERSRVPGGNRDRMIRLTKTPTSGSPAGRGTPRDAQIATRSVERPRGLA
jgi:RepB DNA-primase from phage plasmid